MPTTSDENAARSKHNIVLMMTQREEMQLEDRSIGLQAELNLSTTRKG